MASNAAAAVFAAFGPVGVVEVGVVGEFHAAFACYPSLVECVAEISHSTTSLAVGDTVGRGDAWCSGMMATSTSLRFGGVGLVYESFIARRGVRFIDGACYSGFEDVGFAAGFTKISVRKGSLNCSKRASKV